jgi:hypothetical protein
MPDLFEWADQREAIARLRAASADQPTRTNRGKALPAAVVTDASRKDVARVVPAKAKVLKIGSATLGYYHKPKRIGVAWAFVRQRLREIEALISYRHNGPVNTDDGMIYFMAALSHLLVMPSEVSCRRATEPLVWAWRWVPRLVEEYGLWLETTMRRDFTKAPRRLSADVMAKMLRVTKAERDALGLKTIGAIDFTKAQRAEARKRCDQEYQKDARRKRGATSREHSKTATQPWKAEGMSRASWYRRRKEAETISSATLHEARETDSSAIMYIDSTQLPTKSSHTESALPFGERVAVLNAANVSPLLIVTTLKCVPGAVFFHLRRLRRAGDRRAMRTAA